MEKPVEATRAHPIRGMVSGGIKPAQHVTQHANKSVDSRATNMLYYPGCRKTYKKKMMRREEE